MGFNQSMKILNVNTGVPQDLTFKGVTFKTSMIRYFKMAFVLFAAYTILATSKAGDTVAPLLKNWGVVSTCNSITANNELISAYDTGVILSPANRTFLDYGLPVAIVRIATDTAITGNSNSITRSCSYSTSLDGNSGKTLSIYSCTDNGFPSCIVTFTPM